MRVLVQNTLTNRQWVGFEGPSGFLIGRDEPCDIRLDSRFVSPNHLRVERGDGGWEVELLPGVNAVEIDGKEYSAGQKVLIRGGASLRLMEFVLTLSDVQEEAGAQTDQGARLTEMQNSLHARVVERLDLRLGGWSGAEYSSEPAEQLNRVVDDLLLGEFRSQVYESEMTPLLLKRALRARLSDWIFLRWSPERKISAGWQGLGVNADMEGTIEGIMNRMAAKFGLIDGKPIPADAEDQIDGRFDGVAVQVVEKLLENLRTYIVSSYLKKILYDMIFGLGPLEDLLRWPSVTEIMVVSPSQIYIERNGRVMKIPQTFPSDEAALSIIERIVAPLGRRIDRSQPLVDARLRDGSRVNAIIEPLAIKGPCITIRKFPVSKVSADDLIRWQSITSSGLALLRACILHRCNILVSGGTGSGKTTLLNVLSGMIPITERLVTTEDSAELRLQQEHVVTLETKPANAEGSGAYTMRDLVRNALRMRPDRIIVGECRGVEAVDMLQAMNTGHQGSMTTIHSNSAADAITRLESMVLMAAEIPLQAVRRQIAQAIHLIVHTDRLPNGQRVVRQISEVTGIGPTSGEVEIRDIMTAREEQGRTVLRPTGFMPSFLGEMVEKGHLQLQSWFEQVRP